MKKEDINSPNPWPKDLLVSTATLKYRGDYNYRYDYNDFDVVRVNTKHFKDGFNPTGADVVYLMFKDDKCFLIPGVVPKCPCCGNPF